MNKELPLKKERIVRIGNDLVRAPMQIESVTPPNGSSAPAITATQAKIIRMLVAAIDRNDLELNTYHCKVADLFSFLGVPKSSYGNLENILDQIQNIRSRIVLRDDEAGETIIRFASWVQTADIKKPDGNRRGMEIVLKLNDDILQYVTQLSASYTSYQLSSILSLSSEEIRLYEYIVSHKSLIQEWNIEGKPYPILMSDIRRLLGWDKYYEDSKVAVRYARNGESAKRIENFFQIISERTELQIANRTSSIRGDYIFNLYVYTQDQSDNKSSNSESLRIEQDYGNENAYVQVLSTYYQSLFEIKAGKRMLAKLHESFSKYIRSGLVREAFEYTLTKKESGEIKSADAYARRMIDAAADGTLKIKEENLHPTEYDPLTPAERKIYGNAKSMCEAERATINAQNFSTDFSDAPEYTVYANAASVFSRNHQYPKMSYRFYHNMESMYERGIDIRSILSAMIRTYFQYDPSDLETEFDFWAYTTTVIETSLLEDRPFEKSVEHMTLDWLRVNMQTI